jgi:tRNA-specific 2-thiouridylase
LVPKENKVVVGEREALFQRDVPLEDVVWGAAEPGDTPIQVEAKVRYNMTPRPAVLERERIVFDEPVHAVTPGQIAVAYDGDTVLAGGRIR